MRGVTHIVTTILLGVLTLKHYKSKSTKNTILGKIDTNKRIGAYTITHSSTGKVYHGSTVNIKHRLSGHNSDLLKKKHGNKNLQELIDKDPTGTVVFYPTKTREEAYDLEQKLIDETDSDLLLNVSMDARNGLNDTWNIEGYRENVMARMYGNDYGVGYKHTDEARAAISKGTIGVGHSEESKLRMSLAKKGVKRDPELVKRVSKRNIKNYIRINGVVYSSINEAAETLGISKYNVEYRAKSDSFPEYELIPAKVKGNKTDEERGIVTTIEFIPEIQIGNKIYDNANIAGRAMGVHRNTINFRCNSDSFPDYSFHYNTEEGNKEAVQIALDAIRRSKRKVSIGGIIYDSVKEASDATGVSCNNIYTRCRSQYCPEYFYVLPEE